jgi:O-antigen ligase
MLYRTYENQQLQNLNIYIQKFLFSLTILFALVMPLHSDLGRKILTLSFIILLFVVDYKKLFSFIKNNKFILYVSLFILFGIISILWSDNQKEAELLVRGMLRYWYIPTLVLIITINKDNIKYILIAFLAGMIINEIISYTMYFYNIRTLFDYPLTGYWKNPVPFHASHMEYSIFVSFSIFLFFYFSTTAKNIYLKILLGIFTISSLILLFLLFGRTGQVAFVITFMILALIYYKNNFKILFSLLALILITLFTAYSFSKSFNLRVTQMTNDINKLIEKQKYNSSIGVRLSAYAKIPELIESTNLIYGVGLGDSAGITDQINEELYGKLLKHQKGKLHQSFLTIFHSLGVIGLGLFLTSLYHLVMSSVNSTQIKFIKYSFIPVLLISLATNEIFGQREIMMLFALFSTIILVSASNKTSIEMGKA